MVRVPDPDRWRGGSARARAHARACTAYPGHPHRILSVLYTLAQAQHAIQPAQGGGLGRAVPRGQRHSSDRGGEGGGIGCIKSSGLFGAENADEPKLWLGICTDY